MDLSSLMDYLEGSAGDSLRAVGYHEGDEVGIEYVRGDVASDYSDEQLELLKDWITSDFAADRFREFYDLGESEYVLQKFGEAVVMIIYTEAGGILVSMDSDVDVMPSHFASECLRRAGEGG